MNLIKVFLKVIFPATILFVSSCKKDHSVLGVDVQPSVDDLNAENVRGLPVNAHTLSYDSINSYGDANKFIGSNNDPYFGRTDIGLYLNTNISRTDINFKSSSKLDSAEIVFAINSVEYAGNKDAVLTYSVFPVKDYLDPKNAYFTSDDRHHDKTPISIYSTAFNVTSDGKTVIRIKLDSTYAKKLFYDSLNLTSNEVFQAAYKGYYIAAEVQNNSEGVIYKANLDDDLSGLFLYYERTDSGTDSVFKFTFTGSTSAKYNTVKFTPKQELKNQFSDSTLGATNLYLKGMGMSRLKIQIPFLKNYTDSFKVAVNRAELILYVDPLFTGGTSRYYAPPKLLLLSLDSLSRETYIKDLLTSTDYSRYDGNYNSTINAYVFNLAREAQAIFSGDKKNRGFYLVVADADLSKTLVYTQGDKILLPLRRDTYYQRIVLAGNNNVQLKPVFNLNYVRFKND
jgi:hypothetical protein